MAGYLAISLLILVSSFGANHHTILNVSFLERTVAYRFLTDTPWSSMLLEKLTGFLLFENFPAFYGNRRFNTAFTTAHYLPLS